jgi:hypothetical protein
MGNCIKNVDFKRALFGLSSQSPYGVKKKIFGLLKI